jgi:hypothetical protein
MRYIAVNIDGAIASASSAPILEFLLEGDLLSLKGRGKCPIQVLLYYLRRLPVLELVLITSRVCCVHSARSCSIPCQEYLAGFVTLCSDDDLASKLI